MSISRLPNNRWRVQVYDPATKKNVSAPMVLGLSVASFDTKREAKAIREQARQVLAERAPDRTTVKAFAHRWTSDPLFRRPKESTNITYRERIKRFVDTHGDMPMTQVDHRTVAAWIAGGENLSSVEPLRTMWNDARSAKAGRLVTSNPWEGLGLRRGTRRHQQPPTEDFVWSMIRAARTVASPGFAGWLQVACFTGMRPGELDALTWDAVDFDRGRVHVRRQFSAKTKTFTLPKNGLERVALLTPPAREALLGLPREPEYCFVNLRGNHWTPSSRAYHWNAVRAAVGWDKTLYLATRHFAGWYMRNTLGMDSEDTAVALGHTDNGAEVRRTYGHLDENLALDRVAAAYERAGNVRPLRAVETA